MRSMERPGANVVVEASSELLDGIVDLSRWAALAKGVLMGEGVRGKAELGLTFVAEQDMAALNLQWMGEDGPTDVLAFPLDEASPGSEQPVMLGDVVVCPAVAARYAAEHRRSVDDELALLIVHGVLHVLGHDHSEPEEAAVMAGLEASHLRSLHDPAWSHAGS